MKCQDCIDSGRRLFNTRKGICECRRARRAAALTKRELIDDRTDIYVKISSIVDAWGSDPHEWGLDEGVSHAEVVRFRRQESGQWQLERLSARGHWCDELALFSDADVFCVTEEWVETK